MAWIDYNTLEAVKQICPGRWNSGAVNFHKKWEGNRYIQVATPLDDRNVHYEIVSKGVELHFEGDSPQEKYSDIIEYLMEKTNNSTYFKWESWHGDWFRCLWEVEMNADNQYRRISEFINFFDGLITSFAKPDEQSQKWILSEIAIERSAEQVSLRHENLEWVLTLPLDIPDYQRSYCWGKDNILLLLDDLLTHIDDNQQLPYRLGTVILHYHDDRYDIIDGQQRLVTLSILMDELGVAVPLQNLKVFDDISAEHIAYAKYLIKKACSQKAIVKSELARKCLSLAELGVLILQNTSLDLAYTFFSNQNSRGVALTDYDLLKAHHLRYIPSASEKQALRAAEEWDAMIEAGHTTDKYGHGNDGITHHEVVLDKYLYNLRKWLRYLPGGNDGTDNRIKREYEAAPIIDEVPAFGERFTYYEPIQGGQHFFAWVKKHIQRYSDFSQFETIKSLRKYLSYGSHALYKDATEALLFAYYLKFGKDYLPEAALAILRIVIEHRYRNSRALSSSVLQHVKDLGVVHMIEQATSPTFILAELQLAVKELSYPMWKDMRPIQKSMRSQAKAVAQSLSDSITVSSFKNLHQ